MADRVNRRLPIPGQTDGEDRTIAMIAALASEVAVLRERLDTLERVLAADGTLAPGAIEAFVPDPAAIAARDTLRRRLIDKIFGPVRDALAAAAARETTR